MGDQSAFDVDLSRAGEMRNELLTEIGKLRELERVHWSPSSHCWVVSQHQDIVEGFSGRLPLSNHKMDKSSFGELSAEEAKRRLPNLTRYPQFWITESDPPNHTRLRKLLAKAFGKSVVEGVRPFAQARVAYLMDKIEASPQIEFNEGVARQLPGVVILKLLGLPDELYGHLKEWATSFTVALASALPKVEWLDRADRSMAEMNEIFKVQIAERRAHPAGENDLMSALLAARDQGDKLSEEELLGVLQLIIVAGHDTTSNSMALGTAVLAQNPESWRYMRERPQATAQSVLEIMRFSAMSAAMPRVVSENFVWHGKELRKGDIVFLMIAAGNRDPRAFAEPEKLDLTRSNDNSLTFAPGLHHCIGHLLAKMQLNEYFGALVQRFDGATVLDEELNFLPQLVFRGVASLNLRFHPRAKN